MKTYIVEIQLSVVADSADEASQIALYSAENSSYRINNAEVFCEPYLAEGQEED